MPSRAVRPFLLATTGLVFAGSCDDAREPEVAGWSLEEELRLTATPEQEFGGVTAVAADEDDNIYVLDMLAQQVYVFDSMGTYSHGIGRPGEGPGELSDARGLGVGPDNRIWVPDMMRRRVSVFERDGAFVASIPRHGYASSGIWDRPAGAVNVYTDWMLRFPNEDAGSLADVQRFPIVLRWSGEAGGSVEVDSFPPLEYTQETAQIGGREAPRVYFAGRTLSALDGRGAFWFAHSREYRLYKRSLEGDTLLVVELDAEPAAVAETDVQAVREYYANRPSRYDEDYIKALPEQKPVVLAIFADGAGNVFVMPETSDAKGGTVIDAFGPDGTYWGRAALPQPVVAPLLRSIAAYATNRYLILSGVDAGGTPYVVRLGIRRPT